MEINKLNYELYFVDYHEENLSTEQVAELMVFLEQHADLKAEFEEFSELKPIALDLSFEGKETLKKKVSPTTNIRESNAEDFLIASVENDLSIDEERELKTFIASNPFYNADKNLYGKTKLTPESIIFENKESLKKSIVIPLWIKRASQVAAAAIVLFVVGIFRSDSVVYSPRTNELANNRILDPARNVQTEYGNLFVQSINKISTPLITNSSSEFLANNRSTNSTPTSFSKKPKEDFVKKVSPPLDDDVFDEQPIVLEEFANRSHNNIEHFKTRSADSDHQTPKQAITNFLKKRVLKEDVGVLKSHIQNLELAHTVVLSINKVFGTNLNLEPTYNNEGEMIAYAFESNTFELQRNIKNK
ncbi:MAG: hypothetical protein JKY53_00485 [Flavobacteriales bacterium]|nr:hypothetical protein [Flavobacteriales bacterium]